MRYNEITETEMIDEMPINVKLIGGEDEGSFRKDDITLATNTKAQAKVARIWHTSTADVDLYLINDPSEKGSDDQRGDYLSKAIRASAIIPKAALRPLRIVPRPDAITVILTQNEGDQRIPLTGWMIAHRLYHVFEEIGKRIKNIHHPKQPKKHPWVNRTFAQSQQFMNNVIRQARPIAHLIRSDLAHVGTTKAARDSNLSNLGELVPEAFAQYMLSGRIVFKPIKMASAGDEATRKLEELNAYIERMQGVVMQEFQALIDQAKGKAFRL